MVLKKRKTINNLSDKFNNLKDCDLSIQISLDGFSFCIRHQNEIGLTKYIPFEESSTTPELHLKNLQHSFAKEQNLQHSFKSVNISHVNELCTLVPRPLFDAQNLKQYIKYSTKIFKNDYIVYDNIENHQMVNVYLPFVNLNNFFFDKYGSFEYKHAATILVEQLMNTYKLSEHPKMFVHLYKNIFEIIVIGQQKLLFHNFFNYLSKEDFIYYILFTAEQLHLNPETFELVISGEIHNDDDFYQMAYTYIRDVKLLEVRSNYTFSNEFTAAHKRAFYTLINQ